MNEQPKDSPLTSLPIAAVMLITETLQAIAETDPELTKKLIQRFRALSDSSLGRDNPSSLEIVGYSEKAVDSVL